MFLKKIILSFTVIFFFVNCPIGENLAPNQSQCKKRYQMTISGLILSKKQATSDNPYPDEAFFSDILLFTKFHKSCIQKAKAAEGLYGKIKGND